MGRVVCVGEKRQTKKSTAQDDMAFRAVQSDLTPSEPEVPLEERSLIVEPVVTSETYCSCCEDCYHKRSNWNKFLDWLRRMLWVM